MSGSLPENMERAILSLLDGPKYPDREFVRSGFTFGEVYAMAAWLRAALTGPEYQGAAICLASDNKAVMAAALLASLGGAPPLLLPYAFSSQALARMVQATGCTTAIAEGAKEFSESVQVIYPQAVSSVEIPVMAQASPQDELLKIFTGGSTGRPEVWSKTGANIFAEGFFLARHFELTEKDCIVATIPPYHIYGLLFSVVLPLVSSATVVAGTPSFPGEIAGAVQEHEATILASIPPHYRALRGRKISDTPLRLAFSSAGMLDAVDNDSFRQQNKVGIVEVYGSTETGGIATRNRSQGEEHFTAFPSVDWTIKDHRLSVRSPFISPDVPLDGDGFFTAGDRVEACGNNTFALKGRADSITKVGGKRVDLEEVCNLIKKDPEVADCVVIALPESRGREHRIAALIQGTAVNIDGVRKALAGVLEAYALPRVIKTVNRIPMTNNGKYDQTAIVRLFDT